MSTLLQRITLIPKVCSGKPTIRNMRFTVAQMPELLASGITRGETPIIGKDDIPASLFFASKMANAQLVIPLAV